VPAEREETRLVALDQGLEGSLLAVPGECDELVVALEPEKG
jgi:hypothetical protein